MTKENYYKLKNDKHYYGEYGQQFLSNSNISRCLRILSLHEPRPSSPAFLVGGYFHTAILEPEKLKSFKIVEASNRNTKAIKKFLVVKCACYNQKLIKLNAYDTVS